MERWQSLEILSYKKSHRRRIEKGLNAVCLAVNLEFDSANPLNLNAKECQTSQARNNVELMHRDEYYVRQV